MSRYAKSVAIALLCAIVLSGLYSIGFLSNMHLKAADNLYGGYPALDAIVIAAIDDKSLQEVGRWPWDRTIFAKAIDQMNESKVVGIDVAFFEPTPNDSILAESLSKVNAVIPVEYISFKQDNGDVKGDHVLTPVVDLENVSAGYVNVITDRDGITRAVNLDLSEEHPSFAEAVFRKFWKKDLPSKTSRFLANFVGKPMSYEYVSMSDIINEKVDPSKFKNKLVLVGATANDLHDNYFVPSSEGQPMPGVEFHANTIQTLINQRFLFEQSPEMTMLMIAMICILTAIIITRFNVVGASVAAVGAIILYFFIAIRAFDYGLIMNLVYGPLSIGATYVSTIMYFYTAERKEKKKVYGTLSKYVSKAVVEELMKNPDKLKLGGEKKEITVFFSDVRGFTTISEKLTPEQLVKLLNEYLTAMTDIILKHEGVVDKYIGDAIMAFWGAPLDQPNSADLAAKTCLDMLKDLDPLREKWKAEGFPDIDIGIGLNTGNAVIGNMGSKDRFDYTAMGDTINLGARLEGITKQYGVRTCISQFTNKKLSNFTTRELDMIIVKGKKEPVKIYELICSKDELDEKTVDLVHHFEIGLDLYRQQKWNDAIKAFQQVLEIKKDKAAQLFIDRCKTFKKNPPSKDWNGVWEFKTK